MRCLKMLLIAGMAVPVLYFSTLLLSSLFYPGYSHISQYASELGSAAAPYPLLFNTGIILAGLSSIAAGFGFFLVLRGQTGTRLLPALLTLCLVLFGVSFVMGGAFPMPDERHGGYALGLGIHVAPLLLAFDLWKHQALRTLNLYLIGTALVMLTLFAVMMGVGGLVTRANVGLWQRTYVLFMLPWIGVASFYLNRHLVSPTADKSIQLLQSAI
jgi:hypothetical membrane protein